jgi:hypothetical protein
LKICDRRRVREYLRKKACHRRSFRSINRLFDAVALRDEDLLALFKCSKSNGSGRSRLPVAAKIAFETVGAMGGARFADARRRLVGFYDMNVRPAGNYSLTRPT